MRERGDDDGENKWDGGPRRAMEWADLVVWRHEKHLSLKRNTLNTHLKALRLYSERQKGGMIARTNFEDELLSEVAD